MEYLGHTRTATYMTGNNTQANFLPPISTMRSSYKAYDTYPAPSPLRTTLPWRPSTYYQTARVNPNPALNRNMQDPTSADPKSARTQLTEMDNIKVPPVLAAFNTREADKTRRTQSDVGKHLGQRIDDITFSKTELNHETDNMISQINSLWEAKRILEKALAEIETPLNISQESLYNREKRQAIDLVHDNPERELIREADVIKRSQDKMRNAIEKANVQLSVSVPESWAKSSNDNIQRSQSERAASKQLRNELESTLNSWANEMWQEWNAVNVALTHRIQETTDARNKLQTHLSRVLQENFDMEKNIVLLKKAIQDKQAPMQLANTRLDTRPNVEFMSNRLVGEVNEITDTIESLQGKLHQSENARQ